MQTLLSSKTTKTLAHVALLAAWEGRNEDSEKIFAALEAAKTKTPNIRLCRALVLAFQDRYDESIALLKQILAEQPKNITAKGLLGLVLYTIGAPGWQALLEDVAANGADTKTVRVARSILAKSRGQSTPPPTDPRKRFMGYA